MVVIGWGFIELLIVSQLSKQIDKADYEIEISIGKTFLAYTDFLKVNGGAQISTFILYFFQHYNGKTSQNCKFRLETIFILICYLGYT